MSKQTTTHGGPMTPHTPDGKTPMQEWAGWLVVSPKGNAWRATLADTEDLATAAYFGMGTPGSLGGVDMDRLRRLWAREQAAGFAVRQVAVVENGTVAALAFTPRDIEAVRAGGLGCAGERDAARREGRMEDVQYWTEQCAMLDRLAARIAALLPEEPGT